MDTTEREQPSAAIPLLESQLAKLPTEYTVLVPQDTLSVVVYMNTWVRLKERVRRCRRGVNVWESLFWTVVGVFVPSAVSAYLKYQADAATASATVINLWMVISAVCLITAILALIALRQSLSHESESIDAILDEMEEIQGRFTQVPQ
jgi:cytochrome bd-type quinol oxidase subunit 2